MHQNHNTNTSNDTSYGGMPYNVNHYNQAENHYYSVERPASMIYDPASTYLNYKGESDMLNDMYPSMTMIPDANIDNEMSPNGHYMNRDDYNTVENMYYQSRQYSNSASDNNIAGLEIAKIAPNNSGNHTTDTMEDHSYENFTQSRKRLVNNNPLVYGLNSINGVDPKQPKADKANKGLRHFSMKVCEKVQQKKITTYNEVADELVNEFGETEKGPGNEQNIRRRVYDALNVLMAMNIISKDKKEIRWLGLPSNSAQEHQRLRNEGAEIFEAIKYKLKTIYELIIQQVSLQNLITYNKKLEAEMGCKIDSDKCIQLPFLAISTAHDTDVVCRVNEKKDKYDITFSSDFELHDDSEILKRLGLSCNLDNANCTIDDLNHSLTLVPPNLSYYVKAMAGRNVTEFQEHILNNRGYLTTDNLMEFYNKINKSVFESNQPSSSACIQTVNNNPTISNEITTTSTINDNINQSVNHISTQNHQSLNTLNDESKLSLSKFDNTSNYRSSFDHRTSTNNSTQQVYSHPSSSTMDSVSTVISNNSPNKNNIVQSFVMTNDFGNNTPSNSFKDN